MNLEKEDIVHYAGENPSLKGRLFSVRGFWRRGEVVVKDVSTNERFVFTPNDVEKIEELEV